MFSEFYHCHCLSCLQVATTVKLIVEPNTEDQLADLYMTTFMADFKDEPCLS